MKNLKLQSQLRQIRTLSQEMGWERFMSHVGSIMAEQADKTFDKQSTALFVCSNTIHILNDSFKQCGQFTYPPEMVDSSVEQCNKEHMNPDRFGPFVCNKKKGHSGKHSDGIREWEGHETWVNSF